MLQNAFPVGRISGIRVFVHWSLGITVLLLVWMFAEDVLPQQLSTSSRAPNWAVGTVAVTDLLRVCNRTALGLPVRPKIEPESRGSEVTSAVHPTDSAGALTWELIRGSVPNTQ